MDKLSEYLASEGLTQGAFAALCNVSPSTITRVIRGDINVTADLARTINTVTSGRVTPNDLILAPRHKNHAEKSAAKGAGK